MGEGYNRLTSVTSEYTPPPRANGVVTVSMSETDARKYLVDTRGTTSWSTAAIRRAIENALAVS